MKPGWSMCVREMWEKLTELSVARPPFPHFRFGEFNKSINPAVVPKCSLRGSSVRSGPCFHALLWSGGATCPVSCAAHINIPRVKQNDCVFRFVPRFFPKDSLVRPHVSCHFFRGLCVLQCDFSPCATSWENTKINVLARRGWLLTRHRSN